MPSKRDELHSYQFMIRRLVSAFTYGSADPAQPRFQRSGSALFIGAMIAILLLAGFGVYGLLAPGGNTAWRDEKALILEKETGALFIYRDEKLHPVVNYSSARLILKRSGVKPTSVSANSLRGTARGAALGIPGAPDSVPSDKSLLTGPWHLCSQPRRDAAGPMSVLVVSGRAPTGKPLDKQAIIVTDPAGKETYLVTENRRFRIHRPDVVLLALAMRDKPHVAVSPAWLSGIPAGADIGPLTITGAGNEPSAGTAGLAGTKIGQVFKTQSQSGESQFYVVLNDGLAPVTQLQVDLILHDPHIAPKAYPNRNPEALQRADLANATPSKSKLPTLDAPSVTPSVVPGPVGQQAVCAAFTPGERDARVFYDAPAADVTPAARRQAMTEGRFIADAVLIQPGYGALVEAFTGTGTVAAALFLITDQGVRHALASSEVLSYLDCPRSRLVKLPSGLAQLVPDGPALDPAMAAKPIPTAAKPIPTASQGPQR